MMRALTATTALIACAAAASANFIGIDLRTDAAWNSAANSAINDGNTYTVVRLYAAFDSSTINDRVLNVGQSAIDPFAGFGLQSGRFYEDGLGGDTAPNGGFFGSFPTLQWDSYVSIGEVTASAATTTTDPDFDITDSNMDGGLDFVDGGWFNTNPGNGNGDPAFNASTGNFEVFLGQFTVRNLIGGFSSGAPGAVVENTAFEGRLRVFTPGTTTTGGNIVEFVQIPAPGSLALLGVAGLIGARRRR